MISCSQALPPPPARGPRPGPAAPHMHHCTVTALVAAIAVAAAKLKLKETAFFYKHHRKQRRMAVPRLYGIAMSHSDES